jgi:hypothetical protein
MNVIALSGPPPMLFLRSLLQIVFLLAVHLAFSGTLRYLARGFLILVLSRASAPERLRADDRHAILPSLFLIKACSFLIQFVHSREIGDDDLLKLFFAGPLALGSKLRAVAGRFSVCRLSS